MKKIPLSIAKSYVAHWGWWEGIRELLQNAVDTGDWQVLPEGTTSMKIISRGGKIPISALLMGNSNKVDDDNTLGKFGEGMKLAFLVLKRLGADVVVYNHDEVWTPTFEYNEVFQEECLSISIFENSSPLNEVAIHLSNLRTDALDEVFEKFLPLRNKTPSYFAPNGEAYEKYEYEDGCNLFVNGLYVTTLEGKYKFDYNLKPSAVSLDRDRNTASTFEVCWEASRLLMHAGEYLLVSKLATEGYKDVAHIQHHNTHVSEEDRISMQENAIKIFFDTYGSKAWAICSSWGADKKRLVSHGVASKGYIPIEVPDVFYDLLKRSFNLDQKLQEILEFKPIMFLNKFLEENKRQMRAKPVKKLKALIKQFEILQGKV